MISEIVRKVLKELAGQDTEEEDNELPSTDVNKDKKGAIYNAMKMLSKGDEADDEDDMVKMPKEDFEDEHTKLIDKLNRQDPDELDDEAEEQAGELSDVEEGMDEEDDEEEGGKKKGNGMKAIAIVIKGLKGEGNHGSRNG